MPVIDASLWVSVCHAGDRHHRRSILWLESELVEGTGLIAPTLLQVEVSAAVRRLSGEEELAAAAAAALEKVESFELVPLTCERARRAAKIASHTGVRGADAVYLELAAERGEALVTWDRQQLERGRAVVTVERPSG